MALGSGCSIVKAAHKTKLHQPISIQQPTTIPPIKIQGQTIVMLSMLLSSNFNNYFWPGCLVLVGASCWCYQEYRRPLLRTSLDNGVSQLSGWAIFKLFSFPICIALQRQSSVSIIRSSLCKNSNSTNSLVVL